MWGATHRNINPTKQYIISIHAPRVGSDNLGLLSTPRQRRFQSTLPVWGATFTALACQYHFLISIHAPRVGSDGFHRHPIHSIAISIHAPRVGSDPYKRRQCALILSFQSTLLVWGATLKYLPDIASYFISIHAPRVGSDSYFEVSLDWLSDFNPRSPCGERPGWENGEHASYIFQSTLPVWGAT